MYLLIVFIGVIEFSLLVLSVMNTSRIVYLGEKITKLFLEQFLF